MFGSTPGLAKGTEDTVNTSKTCSNKGYEENKYDCGKPSVIGISRVCTKIWPICHGCR